MKPRQRSERVFEPTPHEIERACEEIQEGWSERERRKRAGSSQGGRWLPPFIDSALLDVHLPLSDLQTN
jgi:hypothetical protein